MESDLSGSHPYLRRAASLGFSDILKAVAVPYTLILYGIAWISAQPFLVIALRLFSRERTPAYQVLSVVIYLAINAACLLAWYKLTKYIRNRLLFKESV